MLCMFLHMGEVGVYIQYVILSVVFCILSLYREAQANINTPLLLHDYSNTCTAYVLL